MPSDPESPLGSNEANPTPQMGVAAVRPIPPERAAVETNPTGRRLAVLSITALGVVYGDIGTSPLYTLRECFKP